MNNENYYHYERLKSIRDDALKSEEVVINVDFGAGSKVFTGSERKISKISKVGITKEKYAKLLFRLVEYFKCESIVELGTSIGLTTLYLASPISNSSVYSFEGNPALCAFAEKQFSKAGQKNIRVIQGNFEDTFPVFIKSIDKIDFLFVDGNHRKEATLNYFNLALSKKHNDSIFVFDDIYWSQQMQEAWMEIKSNPNVKIAIDIFQFGIVFFREENKIKEDVTLRF
jgi:predicted O-methyltransferase YrrM